MKTVFQFIMPTVQDINMMKCTMANPTVGWGDTFIAHWTFTLAYQKSRDTLVAIHAPRHTRTKHSKSNWLFNHTVATSVADKLKRQWLWAANCLRQCFSVTSCAHGGSWGSYSDFYSRHYCSGSTYSLAHAAYRLTMLLLQGNESGLCSVKGDKGTRWWRAMLITMWCFSSLCSISAVQSIMGIRCLKYIWPCPCDDLDWSVSPSQEVGQVIVWMQALGWHLQL